MGLMKDRIEQEKSNKFFMKWDIENTRERDT